MLELILIIICLLWLSAIFSVANAFYSVNRVKLRYRLTRGNVARELFVAYGPAQSNYYCNINR